MGGTKSYRLEVLPQDQEELQDGDILVPVAHFSKEVFSTFGSPFLILLSQGDTVGTVKKKIQNKLGVSYIGGSSLIKFDEQNRFCVHKHISRLCFDELIFSLKDDIMLYKVKLLKYLPTRDLRSITRLGQ